MLLLVGAAPVRGAEAISVCYNYGCLTSAEVIYSDRQLQQVRAFLGAARAAADERQRLSLVIGWLLGWAGQQTPIAADRGGNTEDAGVDGRMDCIDHSTTTTRLLRWLESRGWLRFHRVLDPEYRVHHLSVHHSAQIEEIGRGGQATASTRYYVVDSWFRDNGQPAVVIALPRWLAGGDETSADQEAGGSQEAGESQPAGDENNRRAEAVAGSPGARPGW